MTKTIQKDELLDQLSHYGYSLVSPLSKNAPEEVLVNLLKQNDSRLLEGFPVVFANALREKSMLNWEAKRWHFSEEVSEKVGQRLVTFVTLSYYLFRLFGLEKNLQDRVLHLLTKFRGHETLVKLNEPFMKSETVDLGQFKLSTERLKNTFRNYVVRNGEEVWKKQQDLGFELLLSEVFTTRQKELLKKRLSGKTMSKTENEYFYRVVKKRLKALASDELHQMAQNLLLN